MSLNTILATAPLTTTNYVIKATGTALGNSIIYDNGTNVGIGNTNTSYTLDVSGTGRFTGIVTFGSTLSNGTYAYTLPSATGTLALTSALGDYLPLAGGTLTGALSGTSATFSSSVTAGSLIVNQTSTAADIILKFAINGTPKWLVGLTNDVVDDNFTIYQDGAGGGNRFTINTSGNVGIGTSSPLSKFAVKLSGATSPSTVANTTGFDNTYVTFGNDTVSGKQLGIGVSQTDQQGSYLISVAPSSEWIDLSLYARNNIFYGNGTERMRITSAGNVGIGTSTPSEKLHLYNNTAGTTTTLIIENNVNNQNSQINFKSIYGGSTAKSFLIGSNISVAAGSWEIYDATAAAARLVIQNDGTMLVGGASSSGAYNLSLGNATANTYYQVRSTNTNSLYGADTRGTWMGNLSSKEAYINCPSFVPGVDNATSCGSSSYRWTVVYAVNGSIQTSDERQKTDIFTSDLGLDFINKLNPVSYKWKVGGNDVEYSSVEDEDGKITPTSVATPKIGVRNHYGLIAQQVKEVLGDKDFGGFVHDKETDMMSLRYDQFISPLIKAIQEQQIQIQNLQEQINILAK